MKLFGFGKDKKEKKEETGKEKPASKKINRQIPEEAIPFLGPF
jgi:hypothetical protein